MSVYLSILALLIYAFIWWDVLYSMSKKEHISGSGFTNIGIWLGATALSIPSLSL